jgi:hypothetical protein
MSEAMNDFEKRLAKAMRRVDAPPDVARFLARVAEAEKERVLPRSRRANRWVFFTPHLVPHMAPWLGGAVAALLVVGVFGAEQIHVRQQRERAERNFELSERITQQTLEHTREQLQRAGIALDAN